jgi:hypothetical protein
VKTDTDTRAAGATELHSNVCRHTGLSKPECHCQNCLRDLVARFGPDRRS